MTENMFPNSGREGSGPKSRRSTVGAAPDIEQFFRDHRESLGRVTDVARRVREGITVIDSFIQQHTSVVCPECRRVCCINKHAYYECDDLIYIYALGLEPHDYECREDDEPCQFLSSAGCVLDRTVRPSGCNWFFCDDLFDSMEKVRGRAYAEFDDSLSELACLWLELGAEFRSEFRRIKGVELSQPTMSAKRS